MPREAPYLDVADDLRRRVRAGEWAVGERLPSRAQLAEEYGVGRNVTQRAMERLIIEGVLEGRAGSGMYVRAPRERLRMIRSRHREHRGGSPFRADMRSKGGAGLGSRTVRRASPRRSASSSRWAGSITKASHDQWALARRCQSAHMQSLEAGIRAIEARLALPVGQKGAPGGYRSRREWHEKARRLRVLQERLVAARADWEAGIVRVVRGGKRLARARHRLEAAGLTESAWRGRWEAERWFCQADGESGKRYGNETIRVSPDGEVSIKLPAPLAHLANAPHGRYVLTGRVVFAHRGSDWADRVEANRAIAYRIHLDTGRDRWYLTASWQIPLTLTVPIEAVLAHGVIGVDMNAAPPHDRSDRAGHRTVQARPGVPGREEPRPRIPGPRTRSVPPGRGANAGNQNAQHRPGRSAEHETWQQDSLPLSP